MSQNFSFLRKMNHRTLRLIERSRQYRLRVQLIKKFGMSKERAKELAKGYKFRRADGPDFEDGPEFASHPVPKTKREGLELSLKLHNEWIRRKPSA